MIKKAADVAEGSNESVARAGAAQPGGIFRAIAAVMRDVEAIGKDRRADVGGGRGYNFRGIDDVYNELHPILAKHGVFTVPTVMDERHEERTSSSGKLTIYRILTIQYRFYAEDGSHVNAVVIGEGMDFGDKASNKAMAVGHKYALMQVFAIPTEDAKDPETAADPDLVPNFDPKRPAHRERLGAACQAAGLSEAEFQSALKQMALGVATDERATEVIAGIKAQRVVVAPKAPPPPEIYTGTFDQKKLLAGIFARNGIVSADDMKAISADAAANHVPMLELEGWIGALVHPEPPQDGLGKPLAHGERPTA